MIIDLRWLPFCYRITSKILLLVFECLNCVAPPYLSDLLTYPTSSYSLNEDLVEPRVRLKTYGDRTFSVCAPKLWDNLPLDLRKRSNIENSKIKIKRTFS